MRFLLLSLFISFSLGAQPYDGALLVGAPIPNRILLRLEAPAEPIDQLAPRAHSIRCVSKDFGIYQLDFSSETLWRQSFDRLSQSSRVASLQFDYRIDFRTEPNDTFYSRQPNLERMGFPTVWSDNTGGLTPDGDQIVVAVLDAGFDETHPDLINNLWANPAEIPGDGIDNDGNGFVDDITGWNFVGDQPQHANSQHGTQVTGIVGAEGNNSIGISGTSWNNKLMCFTILEVSDIIAAYDYVITQRRKWQNSNGAQGALVVATNASFGVEGQPCEIFPVWAEMYDRMGEVGVLTAAGTANRSWDVDDWGDMPTTCESEFLIGVGNVGENDRLWRGSAWGATSVDLGAAGQGSYTTAASGGYGSFGSNSAAAPYVTGAIALLYSLPCERISSLVKSDPKAAARLMRMAILRSVAPKEGLRNLFATGGMLDVAQAAEYLEALCAAAQSPELQISRIYPNPAKGRVNVEFGDPGLGPYNVEFISMSGQVVRRLVLGAEAALPFVNDISVAGLPAGAYVLRLSNQLETTFGKLLVVE